MKILIAFTIVFVLLSLVFNIVFTTIGFVDFAYSSSVFRKGLGDSMFYLANWPSLLLKIYPCVLSTDGKIVYEMMGWLTLQVFIANTLTWGLVGSAIGILLKFCKVKQKVKDRKK